MAGRTFQQRLQGVLQAGNLTVSDLARWFDRPHPTVRGWVQRGLQPGGAPLDIEHVQQLLKLLETLVSRKKGFPVPRMPPSQRIAHLKRIRASCFPSD